MAWSEIADPAFPVFVRPGGLATGAQLPEGMAVFVDADGQHICRVFAIAHIVLLVGDDEVADIAGYRVVLVGDFDLVGTDWRVAVGRRALYVAEILAGGDIGRIVVKQGGTAFFDKGAHGTALLGGDPLHGPLFEFGRGRVAEGALCIGIVTGIRKILAVAIGPDHAVAEDDEQRMARQGFGVEQMDIVAKINAQTRTFDQYFLQAGADIVGVVVAVADKGEGVGLLLFAHDSILAIGLGIEI